MEKNEQRMYYCHQETLYRDLYVSCFHWNVMIDETILTKTLREKKHQLTKATWRANVKIESNRENKQQRRLETRSKDNIWRMIDKWVNITTKPFPLLRECCKWSPSIMTFQECSTNGKKLLTHTKLIPSLFLKASPNLPAYFSLYIITHRLA